MTRTPAPAIAAPLPCPRLAALAVVVHEGQVLLVRRRNPPDQGLWGYPGGKVDFGEPVTDAALRELAEETGIIAVAIRQLPGLDIIGPHGADMVAPWHYFLVPVVCRYVSGLAQAADDAEEAAWFACDAVLARAFPMSADVDAVLREALRPADRGEGAGG